MNVWVKREEELYAKYEKARLKEVAIRDYIHEVRSKRKASRIRIHFRDKLTESIFKKIEGILDGKDN